MPNDQAVFNALLRQDFSFFLAKAFSTISGGAQLSFNWHQDAIGFELSRIMSGAETRLIITVPPRNLKSITVSVAWVAYLLGLDPTLQIVCVSYSSELSKKHARDCRAILQSSWYQRTFPNTRLKQGNNGEMDFQTTAGGGRLSTSVEGTLTGRGGDIIIIDDPIKPDEAMSETQRNRVDRLDVPDVPVRTLADRLDRRLGGAHQLADLTVAQFRVKLHQPQDRRRTILTL